MRLKNRDLIVTVTIAATNVIWALLPNRTPVIGIILALPLVFVLPGYALTEALFHKRSLDASRRLLFSLGLSLAIAVVSGLILNLLPVGLQAVSWAALLGLLTVVFSLLAAYLRRGTLVNVTQTSRFRITFYQGILFGLAMAVAIFSVLYSVLGAEQQHYPGFTQLWMLPAIQAEKKCAVRLGLRSFESTSVTYRITMTMNGARVTTWPSVVLAPQEEWDRLVLIPPAASSEVSIGGQLYRLDKPQSVYREVHVTLHNCATSQVTPTPHQGLASAYKGIIFDIPANLTTNMSLTEIQQSGRRNINGRLTLGSGLQGSGPFKGMLTATKQIQFTATDSMGHATFSFEGVVDSSGDIAGSYCRFDKAGKCTGSYGLWSVTPHTILILHAP